MEMTDSAFTFRVDEDLKADFAAVADAQERTAAQLLRLLMRDVIRRRNEDEAHDAWFRDEVEQAVAEAADSTVRRVPHDRVISSWRQQRANLEQRPVDRTA